MIKYHIVEPEETKKKPSARHGRRIEVELKLEPNEYRPGAIAVRARPVGGVWSGGFTFTFTPDGRILRHSAVRKDCGFKLEGDGYIEVCDE